MLVNSKFENNIDVCPHCCKKVKEGISFKLGKSVEFKTTICLDCAKALKKAIDYVTSIKPEAIPDYGDIMTIEDYYKDTIDESLTSYDGYGKFANLYKNEMYGILANFLDDLSEFNNAVISARIQGFTHVVWFNR